MAAQPFAIFFSDLVDSTRIKSHLPGDSLAIRNRTYATDILIPHRQRISQFLAEHQGSEVEIIGDSFFLRFSEVLQAARFAVHVQRSHALDPIQTPLGPLRVRIGIHFGSPEGDPVRPGHFIGQEVDYTARLMSLGNAGQIVLSDTAAVLLRQSLTDQERPYSHGDRDLKGIGRVPVFELLYDDKQPQELSQAALAPSNLPPSPRRLAGRDELLADVRERFHQGGAVVLKAEGGMGKTSLALAAAHAALRAGELPGGVAWISCEFKPHLAEFLRQSCHVFFGDRLEAEAVEVCDQRIRDHLSKAAALLVLDNLETVARDAEYLRWISLIRAPQRVLVTSREAPVGLQAAVLPVAELARTVSIQLFHELCENSGRKLLPRDEPLIDRLCAAVGDHPLAIEILATRAARVPLTTLLQRVSANLPETVAVNDPVRPQRQQSLRASFALSFEPLSAAAQQLLIQTSILPAGISPDLLGLLPGAGDSLTAAEELVDASLWRLTGDRYQAHSLVRQAAWERLPAQDSDRVRLAVAGALVELATAFDRQLQQSLADGLRLRDALDLQEGELPNFLLAADVAHQAANAELLDRLIDSLEYFWRVRGQWHAALHLSQRALTMSRASLSPLRRAKLLQGIGRAYRHLMQFPEAEASYLEAVSLYEQSDNRTDLGEALSELSRVYSWMDRLEDSYSAAERGVKLLRPSGDSSRTATALARLGVILRLRGDFAGAFEVQTESLSLCRKIHDRRGEGRSWGYLGDCHRHQGRWQEAEEAQAHSLAIARELNDRRAQGDALLRIGKLLVSQQRWLEAEVKLQASLAIYREMNSQSLHSRALYFYAQALQKSGRPLDALAAANEAASLLGDQSVGWFWPRVQALRAELLAVQQGATKSPSSAIHE